MTGRRLIIMYSRALIFTICFFTGFGQLAARSTKADLTKLVRISDLIIIGRLEKCLPDTGHQATQDYTIMDAEFVWGDPLAYLFPQRDVAGPVRFRSTSRDVPELDSLAALGQSMIWFLRRSADDSTPPQYFGVTAAPSERRVRKYVANNIVILRHGTGSNARNGVELILRNATAGDLHIPEIEVKAGIIWHSPGVGLTVHLLDDDGENAGNIDPFQEQLKLLDAQDWLLLQPGEEQIIPFDISDYFPLAPDRAYSLEIKFDGVGSSVLVKDQLSPKPPR